MFQQIEEGWRSPLDVIEDGNQRLPASYRLEQPANRPERLLPAGHRRSVADQTDGAGHALGNHTRLGNVSGESLDTISRALDRIIRLDARRSTNCL